MDRSFSPLQLEIPFSAPQPVLALGGELKSSLCLLSGTWAVLHETEGALSDPTVFRHFVKNIEHIQDYMKVKPVALACDLHPDYAATRYAPTLGLEIHPVQHHHAHALACLMENRETGPAIGICCDGTGFGTDRAIWGCEILVCREAEFHRAAHLQYFPLPGGDAAALDTWRPAAGLLHHTLGAQWEKDCARLFTDVGEEAVTVTAQRLAGPDGSQRLSGPDGPHHPSNPGGSQHQPAPLRSHHLPRTSSLGRLFDGTAFLLGLCNRNTREGEAPMALEAAAGRASTPCEPLPYAIMDNSETGAMEIDIRPMVVALLEGRKTRQPAPDLAWAFHETLALALAECAARTAEATGIRTVALSGGCFLNALLKNRLQELLLEKGMKVITHRLSPGDGTLALGQAAILALEMMRRPCIE